MQRALIGLVVVVSMGAAPRDVSAQATRADSIVDFVETFLSGFIFSHGERPTLHVAGLPSQMPAGFELPANASIAGSVEFPSLSFITLRSHVPAATVESLRRAFEAAGWTIHRVPDDMAFERPVESYTYCRDEESVGLAAQNEHGKVSLFYMRDQEMSPCSMPPPTHSERFSMPIPELDPPPGIRRRGGGSSGSDDRWSQAAELSGDISLDAVAAHYVEQLSRHGAEIGDLMETAGIRVAGIRLTDRDGTSWSGTLTVMGDAESRQRNVQVYVFKQTSS